MQDRKDAALDSEPTHVEAFDACYGTNTDYASGIEAWKRDQDQELKAAQRGAGIVRDPEGNVIPSNAGAYATIETRTRELRAQGVPLAEATRIALDESPNVLHPEEKIVGARDSYLGASIESLMHRDVQIKGGSSNGRKRGKKRGGGTSAVDQAAMHSVSGMSTAALMRVAYGSAA